MDRCRGLILSRRIPQIEVQTIPVTCYFPDVDEYLPAVIIGSSLAEPMERAENRELHKRARHPCYRSRGKSFVAVMVIAAVPVALPTISKLLSEMEAERGFTW